MLIIPKLKDIYVIIVLTNISSFLKNFDFDIASNTANTLLRIIKTRWIKVPVRGIGGTRIIYPPVLYIVQKFGQTGRNLKQTH